MKLDLVNIEDNKKKATLFSKEVNEIDYRTGEIIKNTSVTVQKEKTKAEFLQLYLQNLKFLAGSNLTNLERQIFLSIIHNMNFYNMIKIHSEIRKEIFAITKLDKSSVSRGLRGLIDKNILIKASQEEVENITGGYYSGKEYFVNPNIVGKGNFKELKELRQIVKTRFDFKTSEMCEEVTIERVYEDAVEVIENPTKYDVKKVEQVDSNSLEITICDKKEKTNHTNMSDTILKLEVEKLRLEKEILEKRIQLSQIDNEIIYDQELIDEVNKQPEPDYPLSKF